MSNELIWLRCGGQSRRAVSGSHATGGTLSLDRGDSRRAGACDLALPTPRCSLSSRGAMGPDHPVPCRGGGRDAGASQRIRGLLRSCQLPGRRGRQLGKPSWLPQAKTSARLHAQRPLVGKIAAAAARARVRSWPATSYRYSIRCAPGLIRAPVEATEEPESRTRTRRSVRLPTP